MNILKKIYNFYIYIFIKIYLEVKVRPHLQEFLQKVSKYYEIYIFTASEKDISEQVMDALDPEG